jgi:hypothetical protein
MKKTFQYLLILLFLASCEEQTQWDLQPGNIDLIVVDGIITNEQKIQTITLTKPVNQLNEKPDPVNGATVLVSGNGQVYTFHEDNTQPGTYLSDKEFTGVKNRNYSLQITSGNQAYTAKAILEPPAEFVFVRYQPSGKDNQYHITAVSSTYNPIRAAMYEINLDWSKAPGYANSNPDSCKAKVFYYTLPTLDVSEVLAPIVEKVTFPRGTVITEKRYSLTDVHAAFIRAVLLETSWSGGYFNTAAANVPTNLSGGAVGFFGACGVVEKVETVK